ncbi:LOW QUALITY PROTEIN: hypothetical protein TorRG33x02_168580 [Trema orientale]|uniref:Uncharacterized protein n=1 Tax=Trema orientale TaxID=63057 RepID=A0A2P5EPA3_TREOI|nr:LOW QUALITY PROTEIN: hypothetical protein TorRG33x02_168580 [Trema orientale]
MKLILKLSLKQGQQSHGLVNLTFSIFQCKNSIYRIIFTQRIETLMAIKRDQKALYFLVIPKILTLNLFLLHISVYLSQHRIGFCVSITQKPTSLSFLSRISLQENVIKRRRFDQNSDSSSPLDRRFYILRIHARAI